MDVSARGRAKSVRSRSRRSTRARAIFWAPRTARPRSSRWSAPSAKACRISSRFPTAMRSCWATAAPARSGTSPARRLSPARRRSARTAPSARNSPSPRNPRRSLRIRRSSRANRARIACRSSPNMWTLTAGRTTKRPLAWRPRSSVSKVPRSRACLLYTSPRYQPDRRLLLLPAEGVRLRRRPVDRRAFPGCDRPRLRHR